MPKLFPILLVLFACTNSSTNKVESKAAVDTMRKEPKRSVDLSDPTNILTGKVETLELEYVVFGCACANWIATNHLKKKDVNINDYIFIEPARKELELPLYFDARRHIIKVVGRFYTRPDYPKGTPETEEKLDKAKVFRYTKLEVIEKSIHYSPKDDITLTLSYNAIACTCAQWSESKFDDSIDKREQMYLERGNKKLVDADKIYQGNNLPVQIRVTGQFVTQNGYPTGYNPQKGDLEPKKVFRYRKIKVIRNGKFRLWS